MKIALPKFTRLALALFIVSLGASTLAKHRCRSLSGASGMTDSQILSTLASQFNTLYSSSGFTANYDSFTDTLSFNQLLDATSNNFYMADTDTGIDATMSLSTTGTPEPSSLLLLGSGVLA
jgi:hypothetical protein